MVRSIFTGYIGDNLITAVILKIQVYIRHFLALQIEKPLKDQLMRNRVNRSDAQTMQDNTGGSTPPNPEQNLLFSGKRNKVPDNQEVVGKLGLFYYLQLIGQSLLYLRRGVGIVLV